MTSAANNNVVGTGVYLEFRKPSVDIHYTWQVIVLPDGQSLDGASARSTFYQRRISTIAPRKTWKAGLCGSPMATNLAAAVSVPGLSFPAQLDVAAEKSIGLLNETLTAIARNTYRLVNEPCYFEVTREDLSAARAGKVPYKALGRIWKVRKALGFPDEFLVPTP